jgi:probable phosphoglycerate mutase
MPPDHAEEPDGFHQRAFALPGGATEIILVRHGASAPVRPGETFPLLEGRGNPELAPAGRQQAEVVARRLAGEPADRLFVTPLCRTQQTAAPIAETTGLTPEVVPELVEVCLGELDGGEFRIRIRQGDPIAQRVYNEERWDVVPGAESAESFGARVAAGIGSIVDVTGPDAVAIAVVHAGVIGELARQATGSRPFAFVHADNGSISRLVVHADGRWLLRSFNDTCHLA